MNKNMNDGKVWTVQELEMIKAQDRRGYDETPSECPEFIALEEAKRVDILLDKFLDLVYSRLFRLAQKTFHYGDSEYVSEWVYRALGTDSFRDTDIGLAEQIHIITAETDIEFLKRFQDVEHWTDWVGDDYHTRVEIFKSEIYRLCEYLSPDRYHFFGEHPYPYKASVLSRIADIVQESNN